MWCAAPKRDRPLSCSPLRASRCSPSPTTPSRSAPEDIRNQTWLPGVTLLAGVLAATTTALAGAGLRLWDLLYGCLGVAGLLAVSAAFARTSLMPVLSWMGNASLAIFLMHPLATGAARIATLKLLPHDAFLQVGPVTLAGIALPALAYAIALRMGMNWLFAFPRRQPQGSYPASPAL